MRDDLYRVKWTCDKCCFEQIGESYSKENSPVGWIRHMLPDDMDPTDYCPKCVKDMFAANPVIESDDGEGGK